MGPLGHSLAAIAAVPGVPALAMAWALRPAWRGGLSERLGAFRTHGAAHPVWIHGASVGETIAAGRLVRAFVSRGDAVVTSTTTPTGRAVARALRPEIASGLAPLDHPWLVSRALDAVGPSMLVMVETELWPSWIRAAAERDIPVAIVSARLSDRSFPRYRKWKRLLRGTLGRICAVGARSQEDADRFVALGFPAARVEVTGDLKLEPAETEESIPRELAQVLGDHALWVAGSTHEGEEEAALAALAAAEGARHPMVGVVAPRRPERWDEVFRALTGSGRRVVRRSALPSGDKPLEPGDVLLLDSLGELAALWTRATVAFVGGSLAQVGGHNLLEPVQAGRPVLFGPHTENVREAAATVLEAGAGIRVANSQELSAATLAALDDPDAWSARGRAGCAALEDHRGATARALALLDRARAGDAP